MAQEAVVVRDEQPALWALEQDYTGPDGSARTRRGFLARVRVEEYGPDGSVPTSAPTPAPRRIGCGSRAPPGPTSPPSSRCSTTRQAPPPRRSALTGATPPWGEATDDDGTVNRLWRVADPDAIAAVTGAAEPAELLIADGHHRYETARVYAEEIGGEGPQRYVLMCLVALEDPGLTVFPTHRLVRDLRPDQHETLADALRRDFEIERLDSTAELAPAYGHRSASATSTPTSAGRSGSRSRTRRSPTRRCPTTPSPTAGSTPRCSRR